MVTAVIQHKVSDYAAWRKVYDDAAALQKAGGVISESVYQSATDPSVLLILHQFADMAAAEAFLSDPALRETMQRSGVQGEPRVEFYEDR